jgi:hypothetical protein
MNRACFTKNTNLHEQNQHASSPACAGQAIRPLKNNFVRMKTKLIRLTFMTYFVLIFPVTSLTFSGLKGQGSQTGKDAAVKLNNPVTVQYLKANLRKSSPRLVLTPAIENTLKSKLKSDPVVKNYFEAMKLDAKEILSKPELTRNVIGRRLLGTSREMLHRMTVLSMVYRIEKNQDVLKKIDKELISVCNFTDWNPSHFLDVAEMSMAVAFAVDWAGEALPRTTLEMAKTALIDKGIIPSATRMNYNSTNNWNQVCNGGMIAAAIVIAEKNPELAAKTIGRSLDGMPNALKQYAPNGIYPEGATYWDYGTSFSCVTSSLLQSAFGTDFGIAAYPAFLESANFRMLMVAPSGWYFNFADCGDKTGGNGDVVLAWFAQKTGNSLYIEKDKFLKPAGSYGGLSRLAGPGLVWLAQFEQKNQTTLPLNWKGDGTNPVVVFRGGKDDPDGYYFGGKGGRANLSHGNMDAGSFVFELNGVRWIVDPGNQDYNALEQAGYDLWNQTQNSERWALITKGNHGHSTFTVDNERFRVDASAPVIDYKDGTAPEATIDMTALYSGRVKSANRKFIKDTNHSITIEDQVVVTDSTKSLTWAVMTTADIVATPDGATLTQDGKTLNMKIMSPASVRISAIMMDPPPTKFDRKIANLKRVEIRIPAFVISDGKTTIRVRLSSPE